MICWMLQLEVLWTIGNERNLTFLASASTLSLLHRLSFLLVFGSFVCLVVFVLVLANSGNFTYHGYYITPRPLDIRLLAFLLFTFALRTPFPPIPNLPSYSFSVLGISGPTRRHTTASSHTRQPLLPYHSIFTHTAAAAQSINQPTESNTRRIVSYRAPRLGRGNPDGLGIAVDLCFSLFWGLMKRSVLLHC